MAKQKSKSETGRLADFCYEAGMLAKTPRSYFQFLGSGEQNVAAHMHRVTMIAYALASSQKDIDILKVLKMCLFHDFAEARTSDLNYVHQKYCEASEGAAIADFTRGLPFGDDLKSVLAEYNAKKTKESLLAKDADQMEFIMGVKEQIDSGNPKGKSWIVPAIKRLRTPAAKKLIREILSTPSDRWWFENKKDEWWVNRNGKK